MTCVYVYVSTREYIYVISFATISLRLFTVSGRVIDGPSCLYVEAICFFDGSQTCKLVILDFFFIVHYRREFMVARFGAVCTCARQGRSLLLIKIFHAP